MTLALVVTAAAHDAELAADALWNLGVVAVEERDLGDRVELWTSLGDDHEVVRAAASELRWPWRMEVVDAAVSETWRGFAKPIWVDSRIVLVPEWVDFEATDGIDVITVEPGATFGLGDHPTTILSARALLAVVRPGDRVLDVGCGSGVLAVLAARLGAGHVEAIDISAAAVPITRHNANHNGVGERVAVSTTALADVDGSFDVVVANILAPTLVELAHELARVTTRNGRLIVSGVLAEHYGHVVDALDPMVVIATAELAGWAALSLAHPTTSKSGDTSSASSAGR